MLHALACYGSAVAQGLPDLEPLAPHPGRRMEQAVAAVRAAIDDGRMKPGVRYSVYQLAASLGVSRTPVREALLRLEEVGLIKFEARQGFRIQLPRSTDIADIFAVRLALELPAVRRAGSTADPGLAAALRSERHLMRESTRAGTDGRFMQHDLRLHDLILDWAGNQRARSIVRDLRETTRLLGASTAGRTRTIADIDREHAPIVDAIIAGQPDKAVAAMRAHLDNTGRLLVAQALREERRDETHSAQPGAFEAEIDTIWSAAVDWPQCRTGEPIQQNPSSK